MNSFQSHENTWHYNIVKNRIVSEFGFQWKKAMPKDFCTYWRIVVYYFLERAFMILLSAIAILFLTIFIPVMIWLENDGAISLLISFFGYYLFVIGVLITVTITIYTGKYFEKRKNQKKKELLGEIAPTYGFFKMKYLSWKTKICPAVEYKVTTYTCKACGQEENSCPQCRAENE